MVPGIILDPFLCVQNIVLSFIKINYIKLHYCPHYMYNFYVYVNGTLSSSATPLTWDTGKTYSTRIPMFGGTQAGRYGNSDFAIFKVYNRALEEIEITQSYTSLKKRFSI